MNIFEEAVHEDDEFAHASSHSHEWFFTCGAQALIKLFEDTVVSHSAKDSHVKSLSDGSASATNGATVMASVGQGLFALFQQPNNAAERYRDYYGRDNDAGKSHQPAIAPAVFRPADAVPVEFKGQQC